MAGKDIRTGNDSDEIQRLVTSGSLGKGFSDISTENTASLGLTTTAAVISSSLNELLIEGENISSLQTSLQYIVAKTFETRDNTSLSFFSGSQAFTTAFANKDFIVEHQNSIDSISVVTASYAVASSSLSTRVSINDAKATNVTQTAVTGNAGTVTNGVYTTGTQTIGGAKTFSTTIAGNINGNSATTSETTISSEQATLIAKSATIINSTKGELVFGAPDRNGNMPITLTIGRTVIRYVLESL